jgi:hypothetical protein
LGYASVHTYIKNQQKSSFSTNGFVNGIQVSFADSQTNSFINRDLRLNSVLFAPAPLLLPITTLAFVQVSQRSTLRLEVGITLLSPLALSTRLIKLLTIGFALGLGKQDRTATGSDFSGDVDTKQYTLSSYGALELSDKGDKSTP